MGIWLVMSSVHGVPAAGAGAGSGLTPQTRTALPPLELPQKLLLPRYQHKNPEQLIHDLDLQGPLTHTWHIRARTNVPQDASRKTLRVFSALVW